MSRFPEFIILRNILRNYTKIPDHNITNILYYLGAKTPSCKIMKPYVNYYQQRIKDIGYAKIKGIYTVFTGTFIHNMTYSCYIIGTNITPLQTVYLSRCYVCKKRFVECSHEKLVADNGIALTYDIMSSRYHLNLPSWI